jgi:glycosyltransferase involved in cell wall biosynthesis
MKTVIVIPAYNEETRITKVIEKAKKYGDVIVIDDGSSDDTKTMAEKAGACVYRHIINRGVGAALGTGFRVALDMKPDVIITMDADGQHKPEDIERIIEPIRNNKTDVVVGSRFLPDSSNPHTMPIRKKVGNFFLNKITYFLYGLKCTDTQSGFRAFSCEALKKIRITTDRYAYASEMIEEIKRNNLKLKEVPIEAIYLNETKKGTTVWDGVKIFIDLVLKRF